VAREPWEHAHIDRFRRALVMLEVADPDALIADRLSGQGPFVATDPFMAPDSIGDEQEPALLRPMTAGEPPEPPPIEEPPAPTTPVEEPPPPPSEPPKPPVRATEPDIPLRPRKPAGLDIDLTNVLEELQGMGAPSKAAPAAPEPPPQNLDQVFGDLRSGMSRQTGAKEAAEHLALARTYIDMGMQDEAIAALKTAARVPIHRFEAASLLGRMFQKRNDIPHAVEWFERAAEAPAPTETEGRELLYDLGCILDTAGETARALAVFLELQADAGEFRDVAARVDRLSRVQTGG